jgi:hypothetical protein
MVIVTGAFIRFKDSRNHSKPPTLRYAPPRQKKLSANAREYPRLIVFAFMCVHFPGYPGVLFPEDPGPPSRRARGLLPGVPEVPFPGYPGSSSRRTRGPLPGGPGVPFPEDPGSPSRGTRGPLPGEPGVPFPGNTAFPSRGTRPSLPGEHGLPFSGNTAFPSRGTRPSLPGEHGLPFPGSTLLHSRGARCSPPVTDDRHNSPPPSLKLSTNTKPDYKKLSMIRITKGMEHVHLPVFFLHRGTTHSFSILNSQEGGGWKEKKVVRLHRLH